MYIIDPGHDYLIEQALDQSKTQQITFLKRSGAIIKHDANPIGWKIERTK